MSKNDINKVDLSQAILDNEVLAMVDKISEDIKSGYPQAVEIDDLLDIIRTGCDVGLETAIRDFYAAEFG